MEIVEKSFGGYLFSEGEYIDFENIIAEKIDFRRETGALRIRVTSKEVNVDFLEEKEPSEQQMRKIGELSLCNKAIVFEIVDKNNRPINGCGGFNKTMSEIALQLNRFYDKKRMR